MYSTYPGHDRGEPLPEARGRGHPEWDGPLFAFMCLHGFLAAHRGPVGCLSAVPAL